ICDWQAATMNMTSEELTDRLILSLQVMREAVKAGLDPDLRSRSGLSGGDGVRLLSGSACGMLGGLAQKAMAYAIATAELNSAMGRIVAAPTAGASGVVPGVLLAAAEEVGFSDDQLVSALAVAGGIGLAISDQATLAGAEGGCQAECGSGAAMAAGALTYLRTDNSEMMQHAVALALKNQIGLVCDPVAGLVEIPCIKRNAGSAVIALMASDLAVAGVKSFIPADEVILAVSEVGKMLPMQLRETGLGGLANTATGRAAADALRAKQLRRPD
ncbi:MAG TPA: L-serine ammonia-lyase, iron-sulfur-dependent, subunit alpha, partial [Bacillota bacterium]|nr:L-serine ammonia-lyase, iron-sulfur-dependent, subunit alpha [Bacillota bacterium]